MRTPAAARLRTSTAATAASEPVRSASATARASMSRMTGQRRKEGSSNLQSGRSRSSRVSGGKN